MNKQLIELQKGCNATCVLLKGEEYKQLLTGVVIKANISDKFLLKQTSIFMEKVIKQSQKQSITYLIITNIDEVSFETQERFIGIVKDREIEGYLIPENCVIIFTVKDENNYAKVSPKLYQFCVRA